MEWVLRGEMLSAVAGVGLGLLCAFLLGRRARRQAVKVKFTGVKGDRPHVILHTGALTYDLTETGVRQPDNEQGKAVWKFDIDARLIEDLVSSVTYPIMPPETVIKVVIQGQLRDTLSATLISFRAR